MSVPTHSVGAAQLQAGAARRHLEAVSLRLPAMANALDTFGSTPLRDYVRSIVNRGVPAVQPMDDLVTLVHDECARLIDHDTAERAARCLRETSAVLTANHHGVDFFAQSIQSTLALALGLGDAAVVLACGAVPLNNLTFPRGLLAYPAHDGNSPGAPVRVPLFPDRFKRALVCTAPAFDAAMVERAAARVDKLVNKGDLPTGSGAVMTQLLRETYADEAVLSLPSYSEQATRVNVAIWQRLFARASTVPALACLELEALTTQLLEKDLSDPSSLAHAVLFDPRLREGVLSQLDGERACWDRAALARRQLGEASEREGATGSVFFWGLDESARRVPLSLTSDGGGQVQLVGIADDGTRLQIAFDPVNVTAALKGRRLLPSLFASYLSIGLARGVSCLGGYYQAQYLPTMQRGVVSALDNADETDAARQVAAVHTDGYLSGMQAVCSMTPSGSMVPAGPVEIIASGGLDDVKRDRIAALTVDEAHMASLAETLMDAGRDLVGDGPWHTELAAELGEQLADRVVMTRS